MSLWRMPSNCSTSSCQSRRPPESALGGIGNLPQVGEAHRHAVLEGVVGGDGPHLLGHLPLAVLEHMRPHVLQPRDHGGNDTLIPLLVCLQPHPALVRLVIRITHSGGLRGSVCGSRRLRYTRGRVIPAARAMAVTPTPPSWAALIAADTSR